MEILIFIILAMIYLFIILKIYKKNNRINGLKVSIILFILQTLSHIGNFSSNSVYPISTNNSSIQFIGNFIGSMTCNWLIIISLIIAIFKYKNIDKDSGG